MDKPTLQRTLMGIAAAALAAPTAFLMYGLLTGPAKFDLNDVFVAAFIIYTFGLMVSVPASFVFGLPYVLWLQRHGRLSWRYVCIGAAVVGAGAFTGLWVFSLQLYKPLWAFAGLGFLSGLLSGLTFCAVVRPKST